MSESLFLEGLVVTARKWKAIENRGRKGGRGIRTGWTLHRDECPHVARKNPDDLMPAPREAYPDTIECPVCKPTDPHQVKWKDTGDGKVEAWCTACDLTAAGSSSNSALSTLSRRHQAQRDREALAAAVAAGEAPTRVVTRRKGDMWTLHRPDCLYVARASGVLPAPTPLTANVQPCVYCRPSDAEDHRAAFQQVDGLVLATCSGCELTAVGNSTKSASSTLKREHEAAADRAALQDAIAAGEQPTLVVVRRRLREGTDDDPSTSRWTLHRADCWQVGRSAGARPAPTPLDPNTTTCTYCRPELEQTAPGRSVA